MKTIPFFNYESHFASQKREVLEAFEKTCASGRFIMQNELSDFERSLADYAGVFDAIGVGNATDALELLLMTRDLQQGDEVLVSSHTMVATASAVKIAGGVPVPVDVDKFGSMSIRAARNAITSRTVGILPTHVNGRIADMDKLVSLASEFGLFVIEDSAQALGSTFNGIHAGGFGVGGCISFYPAKTLGGFGDGGAVLTNSIEVAEQIRLLRDHGRDSFGRIITWGRNSRLDNVQAAMLQSKLEQFEDVVEARYNLAKIYTEVLSQLSCQNIKIPPLEEGSRRTVFQNFEVQVENRDGLKAFLSANGVGTIVQWNGQSIHGLPMYAGKYKCPLADEFFLRSLLLPLNSYMTPDEVDSVGRLVVEFYA